MDSFKKQISLRQINRTNVDRILGLKVRPEQTSFVAATPYTLAQASTYEEAWMRAIYLDEMPIGLIAMKIRPEESMFYLWRMLINETHQHSGYGRRALELLKDEIRLMGGNHITIRIKPGENGPEGFYRKINFHLKSREEGVDEYILPL